MAKTVNDLALYQLVVGIILLFTVKFLALPFLTLVFYALAGLSVFYLWTLGWRIWCDMHPQMPLVIPVTVTPEVTRTFPVYGHTSRPLRRAVRTRPNVRLLYKQQKGKCWWCGDDLFGIYQVDHRVPLAKGGTDDLGNLCLACPKCNGEKGTKLHFKGRLL